MVSLEHLQNGRYAVLKKLGEGGKGIVFKARDTALDRVVAIKMLKNAVTGEEAYSRFMTEAQAVAKLNHPNIVSIHNIGKEDEKQFFVLEFVDGESLRDIMKTYPEGKCDVQTVLKIAMDICSALQYAHSQEVLHRDIKPENVMITKNGTAKLMDFGLAKMIGQPQVTQEGVIVGTVAYVAPEAALGKSVDSRSDLYSLGAVLYEALSGTPPFSGDDPIKIVFGHIHDHPVALTKLNPKASQTLCGCIMKLLEKDPEKRYQSAEDLLKVLRQISEEYLRETLVPSHKPVTVVPPARPVAARETQLIDRVEEINLLREAVDMTVQGEGGVIFLCGEAGIGKTRLVRELRGYARLRGMQVLYGRCPALFSMDGVPPYVLWSEVLRDYLHAASPEQLHKVVGFYPAEVAKLVPELRQRLPTIPQSLPIGPEHERDRLFEAVSQFITNVSKESPLLVVLDDLQWADQTSLLLTHYLARDIHKTPLLLLGAYRKTDIDEKHPLSPILTELNRERLFQSVRLERMSFNDISEMIKQILEQDDVPKEFCELVYEKTGGNPFYTEEVVKSLKEEETIYHLGNKWAFRDVSKIEFPENVKNIVKARIERLDEQCQNVLTLASLVGNDFTLEAINALTGIEEDELLDLMDKILKTGLIKEREIRGKDVFSFADKVVRDVVYEEISHLRRKKLHSVVGTALEKVYGRKIDEHFGELASHFLESGDKDKALDYFLKAGERAMRIQANSEAISYFQSALKLLEEKEDECKEKAHVLETLGDIKNIVGEYDACLKHWNNALLLQEQLREEKEISKLHVKMARTLWERMGKTEKAKPHHDQALKLLEGKPESSELAWLYVDIAERISMRGHEGLNAARSWAEKALELAKRVDDQEAAAQSYCVLGEILGWQGDTKRLMEYMERALKISLDNNYIDSALFAYLDLAAYCWDYETSFNLSTKAFELAKKVGHLYWMSWIAGRLIEANVGLGNLEKAATIAEDSLALDRKTGNCSHLPRPLLYRGWIYQIMGEWDKSEQLFREALTVSKDLDDSQGMSLSYSRLGSLYSDRGEHAESAEYLVRALEIAEKHELKLWTTGASLQLVIPYIELKEFEKAKKPLEDLSKFVQQYSDQKRTVLRVGFSGAMLLRAEKKWDESIDEFEMILKEWEVMNPRRWDIYEFGRFIYEYARVYLDRNEEGDREKAHSLLNQAMEMFQEVGAKKDIEKVIAKKKLLTA